MLRMTKSYFLAWIIAAVLMTFLITENYAISHLKVSGLPGAYTVEMFGGSFEYN